MLPLRLIVLASVFLLALASTARATTVVPPTFDELVSTSELIFRGSVTAVESGWVGEGKQRRIVTRVSFAVERTLRGEAGATLTLEFLGGVVGDRALILAGWPTFAPGDRGVFFVENRTGRVCPLVRLRHGRYRVVADATSPAERIVRDDYTPLRAAADVVTPLGETTTPARAASPAPSLTLADFESQVTARSAALPHPATP